MPLNENKTSGRRGSQGAALPSASSRGLGFSDVVLPGRVYTLPEAVSLAHGGLPQPECAVLTPGGIQLTIRAEPHTVDRTKVTLEGLYLHVGVVVKLVHLEVLAATDEHGAIRVEGGGVDGRWNCHFPLHFQPATPRVTSAPHHHHHYHYHHHHYTPLPPPPLHTTTTVLLWHWFSTIIKESQTN